MKEDENDENQLYDCNHYQQYNYSQQRSNGNRQQPQHQHQQYKYKSINSSKHYYSNSNTTIPTISIPTTARQEVNSIHETNLLIKISSSQIKLK